MKNLIEKWEEIPCECGAMAGRGVVNYKGCEVRGWICKKCKKEYIHPEDSLKISKLGSLNLNEPFRAR